MKLFFFALVLLASFLVHASAGTDDEAVSALQKMGFVVSKMTRTELGDKGQYKAKPTVWNVGNKQFLSFTTKTKTDPKIAFKEITDYLAVSVGNATSSFTVDGDKVTVTYEGVYDPALKPVSPIRNLIAVLRKFSNPVLGGYVCKQKAIFETKKGWLHVHISIALNGSTCKTATDAVYGYLSENNYLDSDTKSRIVCKKNNAVLKLRQKDEPDTPDTE